jgi:hypothetical protein
MPVPTDINGLFPIYVGACIGPDFVGVAVVLCVMGVGMTCSAFVGMGLFAVDMVHS